MGLDKKAIEQSFIKNMEAGYAAAGNPDEFILPDAKIMGEALAKAIVDHLTSTAVVTVKGAVEMAIKKSQAGKSSGSWGSVSDWHEHQVTFADEMPDANYSVVITPDSRVISSGVARADFAWVDSLTTTGFKIKYDSTFASVGTLNTVPLKYHYVALYGDDSGRDGTGLLQGAVSGSGTIE